MNNVIYESVTLPAGQSPDGETPSVVYVTEESNGFFVWLGSYDGGIGFLQWFRWRSIAIEYGVDTARKLRIGKLPTETAKGGTQ